MSSFFSVLSSSPGFVSSLLEADHACYEKPADRVDLPRLRRVVDEFPEGFRLWMRRAADGSESPAGYAGWYPVPEDVFLRLHENPASVTGRGTMMPQRGSGYIYIFNYSLIPAFRGGTPESRLLLRTLAADIEAASPSGLSAVTVSEDGARVARRFGMAYRGDMIHDDESEQVYTAVRG